MSVNQASGLANYPPAFGNGKVITLQAGRSIPAGGCDAETSPPAGSDWSNWDYNSECTLLAKLGVLNILCEGG